MEIMDQYNVIANQPVVIDNVRNHLLQFSINLLPFGCKISVFSAVKVTTFFVDLVILKGSGVIKAGFAGDQIPKCHFPN